jgi:hypothetical protein
LGNAAQLGESDLLVSCSGANDMSDSGEIKYYAGNRVTTWVHGWVLPVECEVWAHFREGGVVWYILKHVFGQGDYDFVVRKFAQINPPDVPAPPSPSATPPADGGQSSGLPLVSGGFHHL